LKCLFLDKEKAFHNTNQQQLKTTDKMSNPIKYDEWIDGHLYRRAHNGVTFYDSFDGARLTTDELWARVERRRKEAKMKNYNKIPTRRSQRIRERTTSTTKN
jgi:hypothetical protein